MTPAEIITLARAQFGEETALTVSDDTARAFLNAALMEVYEDVNSPRLKNLLVEENVALTSGQGNVLDTWDKVVELYVYGLPAHPVAREVIQAYDYNEYYESPVPIFYVDDSHIWVRPTAATVQVVYINPPSEVTAGNEATEYTDIEEPFHAALADLVTSMMYAQEEDTPQAEWYRNSYQQRLGMLLAPEPAQ